MSKMISRLFLVSMLLFIALTAASGIFIVLTFSFDETQLRLLLTTISLAVYSLTGLCCSSILDQRQRGIRTFAAFGIGVSLSGCAFAVLTNFGFLAPSYELILKGRLSLLAIAFSLAHVSLLLRIKTDHVAVILVRLFTMITSAFATLFLLAMIHVLPFQQFWQPFVVCAILSIAGTITTPILQAVLKS